MSKKTKRSGSATRDAPQGQRRSVVWLGDWDSSHDLSCAGYTTLDRCPEVVTAVDRIADLVGSMTIHLMENAELGDIRVKNELSRLVDIEPNRYMSRSNLVRWIVRTMYLEGGGNAVVYPRTEGGYLQELIPVTAGCVSFWPTPGWGYQISIDGKAYDPGNLLHFVLNPDPVHPWMGTGYRVALRDVTNNLKQAAATEKGFMQSKWKPGLIVKVDALTEEFSSPEGRRRLLDQYVDTNTAGEPWIIPAEQLSVEQVKPLTLADLALADFVKLDKQAVASILGVPPFLLGVGNFNRETWNSFIATKVMQVGQIIEQELTRKLLFGRDWYWRFNCRSLYNYSMTEIISAGSAMVDRMAMDRNEWRAWINLPPREDMQELLALENFIPADRLGDQKKLIGGDTDGQA